MSNKSITSKNLIDLTTGDDITISHSVENQNPSKKSPFVECAPLIPPSNINTLEVFENNPFDRIQRLAFTLDDPFETVSYMSQTTNGRNNVEVLTENLLGISDDHINVRDQSVSDSNNKTDQHRVISHPGSVDESKKLTNDLKINISDDNPLLIISDDGDTDISSKEDLHVPPTTADDAGNTDPDLSKNIPSVQSINEKSNESNDQSRINGLTITSSSTTSSTNSSNHIQQSESQDTLHELTNINTSKLSESVWKYRESPNCFAHLGIDLDSSFDYIMNTKPVLIDSDSDMEPEVNTFNISHLEHVPSQEKPNKSIDLDALKEKLKQYKARNVIKPSVLSSHENSDHPFKSDKKLREVVDGQERNESSESPMQSFVRQGTFNIELEGRGEKHSKIVGLQSGARGHQNRDHPSVEPNLACHASGDLQSEMTDIVTRIGRLFNTPNVNVVQANFGSTSANNCVNPTYIVVMNNALPTVASEQPSIRETKNESPELMRNNCRRRSKSVTAPDKESKATAANKLSTQQDCQTPARPPSLHRRSLSYTTPRISTQNSRRSHYGIPASPMAPISAIETKTQISSTRLLPPMSQGRETINAKKLKFREPANSIIKSAGPLKATVPLTSLKSQIVVPNGQSTSEVDNSFRGIPCTPNVTPSRRRYSNVFSNRLTDLSPTKRPGSMKSRYSMVSSTPTSKQNSLQAAPHSSHRRSIYDLRSPKKIGDRLSSYGITKQNVKAMNLSQETPKGLSKFGQATSKVVLKQSKVPTGSGVTNKENRKPKPAH